MKIIIPNRGEAGTQPARAGVSADTPDIDGAVAMNPERRVWSGEYSEDTQAAIEVAEWDWVQTCTGTVLHHAETFYEDPALFWEIGWVRGGTSCGIASNLNIPGLFSRMGAERCKHCCRILGLPNGTGSPKNDTAGIRPWAESRVAALFPPR